MRYQDAPDEHQDDAEQEFPPQLAKAREFLLPVHLGQQHPRLLPECRRVLHRAIHEQAADARPVVGHDRAEPAGLPRQLHGRIARDVLVEPLGIGMRDDLPVAVDQHGVAARIELAALDQRGELRRQVEAGADHDAHAVRRVENGHADLQDLPLEDRGRIGLRGERLPLLVEPQGDRADGFAGLGAAGLGQNRALGVHEPQLEVVRIEALRRVQQAGDLGRRGAPVPGVGERRAEALQLRLDGADFGVDLPFHDEADIPHFDDQRVVEDLPGDHVAPDTDDRRRHHADADEADDQFQQESAREAREPPGPDKPHETGEDDRPQEGGSHDPDGQRAHAVTRSIERRPEGAACWMGTIFESRTFLMAGSARCAAWAPRSISSSARYTRST